MPKYKLKAGSHIENGKTYKEGDVVESEHNLEALFKGKFELLHARASEPAEDDEDDAFAKARQAKTKALVAKETDDDDEEEDDDDDEEEDDEEEKPAHKPASRASRRSR